MNGRRIIASMGTARGNAVALVLDRAPGVPADKNRWIITELSTEYIARLAGAINALAAPDDPAGGPADPADIDDALAGFLHEHRTSPSAKVILFGKGNGLISWAQVREGVARGEMAPECTEYMLGLGRALHCALVAAGFVISKP